MGISKIVQRAATKGANKIAKLASLSPEELNKMAELRDGYLSEAPKPDDLESLELTGRLLAENSVEIYNAYLPQLSTLYSPIDEKTEFKKPFDMEHNTRFFKINKWVVDAKENNLEKLVNVYAVLSKEECNIALIFHRMKEKTDVYLAITNTRNDDNNTAIKLYKDRLDAALKGNFPGAKWEKADAGHLPCFDEKCSYSVASASNIPTEKSEKFISQTIEKLLDGNIPAKSKEEYVLILLATPVLDVEERKLQLADYYSGLAPYAGWSTNFTFHQSDSTTSMATFGINAGVSAGVQNGVNQSRGENKGTQHLEGTNEAENQQNSIAKQKQQTINDAVNENKAHAEGLAENHGETITHTIGGSASIYGSKTVGAGVQVGPIGGSASTTVGASASINASKAKAVTEQLTNSITDTITQGTSHSVANTIGNVITSSTGKTLGKTVSDTVSKTLTTTKGISKAVNFGGNFGANFARSSNVTATVGKDEGITQNFTNYTVKHTLEILEQQMKRYEQSVALGMWDFAAYVLSEDYNVVNNVAHSYLALTQGEESYLSQSSVNLWHGDNEEAPTANEICKYLFTLRHPVFGLNPYILNYDETYSVYPAIVTATTSLSGKELAYSLNMPRKSIVGFPVIECAEFARNVVRFDEVVKDREIKLGDIFHMHHVENVEVNLSLDSLSSHTFITGSTGSGKSNTVHHILDQVQKHGTKFLVVEPAKGEYKHVFGNHEDVSVYGTNSLISPLLRINPFSFPKDIHVLEHLDRLVEIFNVCWPMYAAMPAVLKNAIERSYEDCGWNLTESTNEFGEDLYPTFADVARNIKTVIESSEYDTENKGAYKGSLLTRLNSLTNGINGQVFVNNEIPSEDLFDKNVIIDLSRVGSSETKSLLMGMIVLKLQEYRMSNAHSFNQKLKHITVLEEAHNLLKRTSTEQPIEGGNLAGKSVEMLTNAIAEMRTYGEGFIIADQAPGLLDLSVIRNTNTKIIMRLPDEADRILVGKAANLKDDQINELARLPLGVAAVYQNDWIQPALCKVEYYDYDESVYEYTRPIGTALNDYYAERIKIADLLSNGTKLGKEAILKEIVPDLKHMELSSAVQVEIMKMLMNPSKEPRMKKMAPIMGELFPEVLSAVKRAYNETREESAWTDMARDELNKADYPIEEQTGRDIIQGIMTYYFLILNNDIDHLREWSIKGGFS